jgi:hypothetical protein
MDKNAYQNELDQVHYTDSGRAQLTAQLMQAQWAEKKPARRFGWMRRGAAAAIAAVLLVGTAAAVGNSLWENYFGHLDEGQQTVIDQLSQDLPAVTSNGTVMKPLAAFGDREFYYLMLEIQAPEGTVLPAYSEDEGFYQLFGDRAEDFITLKAADGTDIAMVPSFSWIDEDPTDNILTAVIQLWSADGTQFNDGQDKILHIPGLWVQSPDKEYTPILTGSWEFNIGGHVGDSQTRQLDVTGVTTENDQCGALTLEKLEISSLGMYWRYSWSEPVEGVVPGAELTVVLDDGSTVSLSNSMGSFGENWSENSGYFATPIDVSHVTGIRWGDTLISMN